MLVSCIDKQVYIIYEVVLAQSFQYDNGSARDGYLVY